MNRNNGKNIAVRLIALRDYLHANADQKHAVNVFSRRLFILIVFLDIILDRIPT